MCCHWKLKPVAIFALLFVILSVAVGKVGAQAFDIKQFQKLAKADRLAVALAGMRERADALANLDITFSIVDESTNPEGNTTSHMKARLQTIGSKYRIEQHQIMQWPTGLKSEDTIKFSWDGTVSTIWTHTKSRPNAGLLILEQEKEEPVLYKIWSFTEQLGTRQHDTPHRMLTDWIELWTKRPDLAQWDVNAELKDNEPVIKVSVKTHNSPQHYEYAVSPARQFAIVNYTFSHTYPGGEVTADVTTNRFITIDGVNIPSACIKTSLLNAHQKDIEGKYTSKVIYEVETCKLGLTTNEDISIVPEAGTVPLLVLDRQKQDSYTIEKNGTRRPESFFNSKTGKVVVPPTTGPATQPLEKD